MESSNIAGQFWLASSLWNKTTTQSLGYCKSIQKGRYCFMKQVSPREARQGREGKPVLVILLVSIAAAAFVWLLVELFGSAIAPEVPSNSEGSVPPASTETVPPASGN
jgi:hypothetical protein